MIGPVRLLYAPRCIRPLSSTGRVGSNVIERAIPAALANATSGVASVLPSTHQRPYSSHATSPDGLSHYDGVLHMVRHPIDVALSYIESGALYSNGSVGEWDNNNIDWGMRMMTTDRAS